MTPPNYQSSPRFKFSLLVLLAFLFNANMVYAQAPSITTQPSSIGVCAGSNTTFSIVASNTTSYQWQVSTNSGSTWNNLTNTGIYSGATTATITLTSVSGTYNNYRYRCVATGSTSPAATSNSATLTVTALPTITSTTGGTTCSGTNGQVSAVASTGATVTWHSASTGGSALGTGNTLTIPSATTTTTYYAGATIGGAGGSDTAQTPYNTNNGQRGAMFDIVTNTAMTVTGFDVSIYSGTTADYYIYYKVGTHVGFENNSAAWTPLDTVTGVTSAGNNVPTPMGFNIAVALQANTRYSFYITNDFGGGTSYTDGTAVGNYLSSNSDVTFYEGVGKSFPFGLTFTVRNINATMYYTKSNGCVSNTRTGATLTVNSNANITTNPPNRSITSGSNTTFNIAATNATTYQWQVSTNSGSTWNNLTNTGIYSGATSNTLSLTSATSTQNGYQYRCIASNVSSCPDTSSAGILSITGTAPAISAQPVNRTICSGANTTFSVTASGTSITYQWQVSTNSGSTWNNLSNTGIYSGATTGTLTLTAPTNTQNGYQYRCVVTGAVSPAATSNAATLTINPTPTITANPSNSIICTGTNTSFNITATNVTSYQWQVSTNSGSTWNNLTNTGINSGTTTNTLSLTGATSTQNGYQYRCIASGTCTPNATSNSATLTINPTPAIATNPSNSTICTGTNTSFNITATNVTSYQWQVSTNSGSTWNNLTNTGIYSGTTTNTLTLTAATITQNGYQYRCIASGTCAPNATSNAATLTINSTPAINTQPTNSTICTGTNTSFNITATNATSYQWQVSTNSGSTWNNLTNTGIYSGTTTNTLSLTGATSTQNGYQYKCIASGTCAPNATSNVATLNINVAPVITTSPSNSTIGAGSSTAFNVIAANATGYQWQVSTNGGSTWNNLTNTGIYSGTTTSTLNLTNVTAVYNTYQYRCIISGTCTPNATSNVAILTVNSAPAITTQPTNSTICTATNTSFNVTATNATSYQWQVSTNGGSTWNNLTNTGIYSGTTTNTLILTAATITQNGYQYRCEVTGATTPNAISNTATLSINIAPAISGQPSNSTTCENTNTSFTVTATNATTYQWQVNTGSGWNNISNTGVYTNATTNTLNITGVTASMNTYQYRCIIAGNCTPVATSNAAILSIDIAPLISSQPSNRTICNGENTTFPVTATGTALTYQWQVNSGSGWNNISNTGIYSNATTSTLTLTAAGTSVNSYQYRCIVSGTCTPSKTSNAVTITIHTPPAITTQPISTNVCSGGNTSIDVTATGHGLTYQWQVHNGSIWTNLTNGGIYSGVTTNTLSLTGVTSGNVSGYQYRCIINGTCTPNITSNVATLSINSILTINNHPSNSSICPGANTSFSVAASATGLTYQWQVNNGSGWNNVTNTGIYSGATTSTLNISGATATANGNLYRCLLSSTCTAPSNSNAATLTIYTLPTITTQPVNATVCANSNASFSVTALGSSLTYQWQENTGSGWNNLSNTGIYSGATSATLNLTAVTTTANGYQYRCIVSGTCTPNTTSNAATVTVETPPVINTQPANTTTCAGSNATFSVTASGAGLTYQWQENTGSGWNNLTNTSTYNGVTSSTLNLIGATTTFDGNQYRCMVSGTCTPNITSNSATITINSTLAIITQPANSTICSGNNTSFTINASASGLTYQWQENTGSGWNNLTNTSTYNGVTSSTLNLIGATTTFDGNQYRCVLNSTCTALANSNAATLTINVAPSITTQPASSTVCAGSNTSYTIVATGSSITYQWQVNNGSGWNNLSNTGIYSGTSASTLNITGVTTAENNNQYRCIIGGSCVPGVNSNSVTLAVNDLPLVTAQPVNSTICSGSNTSFNISASGANLTYQWQVNTGSGWNNLTNTGIYNGATSVSLNLTGATTAVNGNQYRCLVSGTCAPIATSNAASLTINSAPSITVQPNNSTLCEYGITSFSINASGTNLTYQWQVNTGSGWNNITNGGFYTNATTNTLTITGVTTILDGNQYRCIVGGTCIPGVNSNPAILTVNNAPSITAQPNSAIICSGDSTTYIVSASGSNLTYQWQVNTGSGWNNLSNTGIYYGATNDSLHLLAATTLVNGNQYRCIINGACAPSVTSTIVSITVNTAPSVSSQPTNKTICEGGNTSFNIIASGTNLTYQWQVNNGSGWNNLSNTGIYSGTTTGTLLLTGATVAVHNYQYRCILGGTCLPGISSSAATLSINTAPVITTNPSSKTICSGDNTTFNVSANGTGLAYQWQVNDGTGWIDINNTGIYTGATSNTLNLINVNTSYQNYNYRCIVSGTCIPSATTTLAVLTINSLPTVTTQPTSKTICVGDNTSFTATGTGNGITYRWKVNTGSGWNNVNNGGFYSNATTSTLNITNATTAINGAQYRCVMSGTCPPSVNSNIVTLTVNTLPSITNNPNNKVICDGNNTSFSINATGTAITYQWQVNSGSGWTNITNGGVYTNVTTATLSLTGPNTTYNNNQYRCIVNGYCSPSVTSSSANLTVHPIVTPSVSITSSATTICAGTSVTFSVSSLNNGGNAPSYQWKKNGSNVGSNATSYTTTGLANGDVITCVMTTNAPCPTSATATSNAIAVTVNPLLLPEINITSVTGDSVCATRLATFFANTVNGGTTPIYQWKLNGVNVGTNNDTFTTSSLNNGDVITCQLTSNALCATPKVVTSKSIKMKVIPLSFSTAKIHATPNNTICQDDQVVVYCYFTDGGPNPTFDWFLNGNKISNSIGSYTSTQFADGDTVHCIFTNGNVCPEPVVTNKEIITVNQNQTSSVSIIASSGNVIAPGWTVTFTALPTNPGANPTYAWRKNGQFIAGITGPTYTDSDLKFGDKIDAILKADWPCKINEYVISNTIIVNIPASSNNITHNEHSLTLFPNPNKGVFMLRGDFSNTDQIAKISVINELGQKVYVAQTELKSGELNYQLKMPNSTATGMYIIMIKIGDSIYHRRFNIIE